MIDRKLSAAKLRALLQALHSFWYDMENAAVRRDEEDARVWIVETLNQLPADAEDPQEEDDLPAPVCHSSSLWHEGWCTSSW